MKLKTATAVRDTKMFLEGKVVWWSVSKQNGILATADGKRFFFHVTNVLSGPEKPARGQRVTFVVSERQTKPGLLPNAAQVTIYYETVAVGVDALKAGLND